MDSQPAIDTFAALADLARDVQRLRGMVLREQRRLLEAWQPYLIQKVFNRPQPTLPLILPCVAMSCESFSRV